MHRQAEEWAFDQGMPRYQAQAFANWYVRTYGQRLRQPSFGSVVGQWHQTGHRVSE